VNVTFSATLYVIISYYWNIFVYLALALYLLRRILGSSVIPEFWAYETDETYRDYNDNEKRRERIDRNFRKK